jgi:hypothetical protein
MSYEMLQDFLISKCFIAQIPDENGDEADGYDEFIFPLDYDEAGEITDDVCSFYCLERIITHSQ